MSSIGDLAIEKQDQEALEKWQSYHQSFVYDRVMTFVDDHLLSTEGDDELLDAIDDLIKDLPSVKGDLRDLIAADNDEYARLEQEDYEEQCRVMDGLGKKQMSNNYLVQLKNGTSIAVDLNMNYGEGLGDIEEVFSAMKSGERSMVFYQSVTVFDGDKRQPLLIALPEIVAITPLIN